MSTYTAHDATDWVPYLFHDEIDALHELAAGLPQNAVVVNIGAGNGTSALALMEANDNLRLYTVDIQQESSPFGCLEGEWAVLEKAGQWPSERYNAICGDSKEVGKTWPYGPVDLVFIDGDHSYDGVHGDILAWLPHVRPGGLLVVHDYHKEERFAEGTTGSVPHPRPWPGVDRAVDELLLDQYEQVKRIDTLIAFRIEERKPAGDLPNWLQPGTPTPFEIALRIEDKQPAVPDQKIPAAKSTKDKTTEGKRK